MDSQDETSGHCWIVGFLLSDYNSWHRFMWKVLATQMAIGVQSCENINLAFTTLTRNIKSLTPIQFKWL